ncbi:MAG TPA: hypothetical protein VMS64_32215 [Candidatus Methylomirabilis sp.]|nr:hypothetical protein [Candidatus Methylomirabilis sp.]
MSVDPRASQPTDVPMLANILQLMTAYCTGRATPAVRDQGEAFGTSGQRRPAITGALNEGHVLAITRAMCLYQLGTPG